MAIYQSPFTPAFDTPGTEGSDVAHRGGIDLGEGSRSETPNASDIPLQPDFVSVPSGPGEGAIVPLPDLSHGRTIATK